MSQEVWSLVLTLPFAAWLAWRAPKHRREWEESLRRPAGTVRWDLRMLDPRFLWFLAHTLSKRRMRRYNCPHCNVRVMDKHQEVCVLGQLDGGTWVWDRDLLKLYQRALVSARRQVDEDLVQSEQGGAR